MRITRRTICVIQRSGPSVRCGDRREGPSTEGGRRMSPLNASLRRLVFLAPLAATAVLGGSALGDPAAACAEPKQWNEAGYHACVDQLNKDLAAGRYTPEQYIELVQGCCSLSGGAWNNTLKQCESPPAAPAQGPAVAPQPGVATQTVEPAPPPVTRVPLGPITENFTPAPVS